MIEQSFIFGPENHLIGTATLPAQANPVPGNLMALLTNAGVIPRIGPHRLNVKLARRIAQLGLGSLRYDMSGLGDSRRSSSRLPTGEQFVADTIAAMDLAKSQFGCEQFFMVGFCSGGDVAHLTALTDARLRGVLMWDSYVYPTRKARALGLLHRLRRNSLGSAASKIAARVGSLVKPSAPSTDAAAGESMPTGPTIFGRSQMPARDDFGNRIRTLVDRGVELQFLYSGGEPEWYNYEAQFRDMFDSYGFVDRVGYAYLVRNDHTLIQPHSQLALIASVEHWLERRLMPRLRQEASLPREAAQLPAKLMPA